MIQLIYNYLWSQQEPINLLPEHRIPLFEYLNGSELGNCRLVCRAWNTLLSSDYAIEILWNRIMDKVAFGTKQWLKYYGDVGKEPTLPKNIRTILIEKCPIWPHLKVYQTHRLILKPKTLNGTQVTLSMLANLTQNPRQGKILDFNMHADVARDHGRTPVESSQWLLVPKWPIDIFSPYGNFFGSECYSQQEIVQRLNKNSNVHYHVPNVLDAAISFVARCVTGDKVGGMIQCQEETNGHQLDIDLDKPDTVKIYDDDQTNGTPRLLLIRKL